MEVPSPAARPGAFDRPLLFTALLAAAMTSGTALVQSVAVLASFLIGEFSLTRSQIGWMVTLSVGVAALLSPGVGRVTDRLGGRRMLAATLCGGGLGFLLLSSSPAYWFALIGMAVTGCANAACNPATNKLIALHVPAGRRGTVTGVKQSGVQAGIFLVGLTLPPLAILLGWRLALVLPGLAFLGMGWWSFRALPADPPDAAPAARTVAYRYPGWVRRLAAFGFLMGAGGGTITAYLPLFAHEVLGLSVAAAGLVAGLAGLVGVGARIWWSRHAERIGVFGRPLALMAALAVVAAAFLYLSQVVVWLVWVAAFLTGAAAYAWNGVGMLAIVAGSELRHTGRASGLIQLGFLSGFAVSPPVFGHLVDLTGSYGLMWSAAALLFLVAVAVGRLGR